MSLVYLLMNASPSLIFLSASCVGACEKPGRRRPLSDRLNSAAYIFRCIADTPGPRLSESMCWSSQRGYHPGHAKSEATATRRPAELLRRKSPDLAEVKSSVSSPGRHLYIRLCNEEKQNR